MEDDRTGTHDLFLPDSEIFEELEVDAATVTPAAAGDGVPHARPRRSSSPTSAPGARRSSSTTRAGSSDFVAHINQAKDPIHKRLVYFEGESDQGSVEVAMQWNNSYQESVFTFANNINTVEGGSHLSGFRSALTSTLNRKYARDEAAEGEGREARGRRRARRSRRRRLGEAAQPAVRGPDEDEARQPRRRGSRPDDGELEASRSSSRRTRRTRSRSR